MEENAVQAVSVLGQLGAYTPWIIAIIGAVVITQFLIQLGRWEHNIPWQIRAFTRVLIMVIFVYLLQLGILTFLPEKLAERVEIFSGGLTLIGDILKILIGAVVGALSTSIKDSFGPNNPEPPPPKPSETLEKEDEK